MSMTKHEQKQSHIPEFTSREDAAAWFDAHDMGDYLDEFTVVDSSKVQVEDNLSTGITVRLTPELLSQLRTEAKAKGIKPSTLARIWIVEQLQRDEGSAVKGQL